MADRPRLSARLGKLKTTKDATGQAAHDLRIEAPGYLETDPTVRVMWYGGAEAAEERNLKDRGRKIAGDKEKKKKIKSQIKATLERLERAAKERYAVTTKQRPQQNAQYFRTGVITLSPEPWQEMDEAAREKHLNEIWKAGLSTVSDICDKLNVRPIYVTLHTDEKTPHIQYMIEATDKETGRSVKGLINRNFCRQLQDMAAEYFRPLGYERGISRDITGAKHLSVRELHRKEQARGEEILAELNAKRAREEQTLEGLEREIERATASLTEIKTEIKAKRATQEQIREMDVKEREDHKWEMAGLRREQRELRELLERMRQELEQMRIETEKKRQEAQLLEKLRPQIEEARAIAAEHKRRREGLSEFLRRLQAGGVQAITLARRPKMEKWIEDKNITELRQHGNFAGIAEERLKLSGEHHIKIHGLPPVFALDDISTGQLERIKDDFGGTLATVETSKDNYQVWLAFDIQQQQLNSNQYAITLDYLIERYRADRAAARAEHYFRLPGFTRADGSGWVAEMETSPPVMAPAETLSEIIQQHGPTWEAERKMERKAAKRMDLRLDEAAAGGCPDWFAAKWLRRWSANNQRLGNTSECDYATAADILRECKSDPAQQLVYAAHIKSILDASGAARKKSRYYGLDTIKSAAEAVGMEM
ncbi:MAG: DNA-primase RepB domain-containing protein [Synergistaceae bacterium]|nr:DNA-primase RepB domain-containing protein [Synergistaceae bacterium]